LHQILTKIKICVNQCSSVPHSLLVTKIEEDAMKFTTGDAIIHPVRGAGVVERIVERRRLGNAESGTMLMVPTNVAGKLGLRGAISLSDVGRLWRILLATPKGLPDKYKELRQFLEDKLGTGDIFQVAEAVRDMAWQHRKTHLSSTIKRLYEEGIRLLVGEIAAARGIEFADAERQVRARLREHLSRPQ
jgi:CarD family transcriptional regulator